MILEDEIILSTARACSGLTMRSPSEIIRAVGTMTQHQQQTIEQLAARTQSASGDLLRLARECQQDGAMVHLAELDRYAAGDMIEVLEDYERHGQRSNAARA